MRLSLGRNQEFLLTAPSDRRTLAGMRRRAALLLVAVLLGLLAAGCNDDHRAVGPIEPDWHRATLPVPPGAAGRLAVRDATACDGHWYLVGGVIGANGASRPVAWSSDDARTWQLMALAPRTYYARRAVLSSVACRDGKVAAVGSRSGGAHGNPRVTSWYQRADGALVDMRADFELYGGPQAITVQHVAAGPDGWLIAGIRLSGAAVWFSRDATDFRLIDDDPALRSDPEHATSALDQTPDSAGWTVVGRIETPGRIAPLPFAWTSADGEHWTRQQVPAGTRGFGDLERVVLDGSDLVAAGIRGQRFGLWRRDDGHWTVDDAFGAVARDPDGPPFVSGLVAASGTVVAAASDGARFHVWAGTYDGSWREVGTPTHPHPSGDTALTIAGDDHTVLLLSDDGTSGGVWTTPWNTLNR